MATGVAMDLRAIFEGGTVAGLTDGQLLERFASGRADEAEPAFAALVERHGAMVLGACRGLLGGAHDAEDAFQATFLTLARKAGSLRHPERLGPWLHGVACHTARRLRDKNERRRRHEAEASMIRANDRGHADGQEPWRAGRDEIEALHEEIERLPDRYRTAIILCDLQGLTHQEAGRRLHRPAGTISARLSRARERLRERLRRRGLEVTSTVPIAAMARDAAVPTALRAATVAAARGMPAGGAAALARRVLRELSATRLKITVGAVAAMAMLAAGIGLTDSETGPPAVAIQAQTGPDDRGADSLPKFARARLGDLRFSHGVWVERAVYTPDGRSLVTLDHAGRLRVWDADAGRICRMIGDPALRFNEIAVAPDGTTVATVDHQSRLQLWDLATGRERRRWHEPREGFYSELRSSPDGRTIAVVVTRRSGDPKRQFEASVELVDTTVPTERRRRIEGGWKRLSDLRFSPDGRALATSAQESAGDFGSDLKTSLRLWDVAAGRELWRASFQGLQVGSVAFSPDRKRLAADLSDGTIRVYDPATGGEIAPTLIRPDAPRPGEPPPPRHAAEQATRDLMGGMTCLAFSPDGTTLAAGSRGSMNMGDVWVAGVHLWDVASGRFLRRIAAHQGWILSLDFSSDGRTLATTGTEAVVRVWGVADGREVVPQVGHRTAIRHLVVAPDGRTVFTAGQDGTVRAWDVASGRERGIIAHLPGYIHGMAVAPDGKALVVSALFDGVTLWDVAGRRLVHRFDHGEPEDPVHGLAFSPDGRTVLSGREAWDVATGRVVGMFPEPDPDRRRAAAWSPAIYAPDDWRVLVPGNRSVSIWDRVAGRVERRALPGGRISADARLLAVGVTPGPSFIGEPPKDPLIRVYEIATGREVRKLAGHQWGTGRLAFSPDGRWLASGGASTDGVRDTTVRIWDLTTGRDLRRFEGHLASVNVLAFTPDGRSLVSGGEDGMAFVWDLSDLRGDRGAGEAADPPRPRPGKP